MHSNIFLKKTFKNSTIYIFFLLLIITIFTISKYVTKIYGLDTARVARYSINEEIDEIPVNLGKLDKDNNTYTYDFIINNKSNEVSYKYKLYMDTLYNIPYDFKLYKDGKNINILNEDLETDWMYIYASDEYTEHKYSLVITLNDYEYYNEDLIDYLDINIESVQID